VGVATFGPIDPKVTSPTYGYITTTPKEGWKVRLPKPALSFCACQMSEPPTAARRCCHKPLHASPRHAARLTP
jgi:hypothetical protein